MLEIGKRYMFNAKKAIKNKVPDLYSSDIMYYKEIDGVYSLVGKMKMHPSFVLWTEQEIFEATVKDAFGDLRQVTLQKVKICRPWSKWEVAEEVFAYPGPLVFVTEAMDPQSQKFFEDKFINTVVHEQIMDLW